MLDVIPRSFRSHVWRNRSFNLARPRRLPLRPIVTVLVLLALFTTAAFANDSITVVILPPQMLSTAHRHDDPDAGADREFVTSTKDHLFLVSPVDGILCYEPGSDTWYGPLEAESGFCCQWPLGTAEGLWVGGADRTAYVRTADFLDAAKAAGRIMTTAEVRQRKQQLADSAGPLAAARFDLSLHDFDGAQRKAEAALAGNPSDPQALLIMAAIHDFWCRNRPDQAMAWYRKLSALESDRSALLYTGLYGEFRIHYALGQWDQALDSGERLLDKVPFPGGRRTAGYSSVALAIESFMRDARQKRDNPGANAGRTKGD